MNAIILIGGLGTRLRPLTCNTPKPLLPLVNIPFILYQIELLKKHGIKQIVLCLSYHSEIFKKFLGNGENFGVKIDYTVEKIPLGTGGAVKYAENFLDDTAIIFNGDILTDLNLKAMLKFHLQKKSKLTISLTRVKDPTIYGLIDTDKSGRIERFIEKPSWDEVTTNAINAGTYIFEKEIFRFIPPHINYSLERGLFPLLLEKKFPIYGFTSPSYWLDIGTVEKYIQAHMDILEGKIKTSLFKDKRKIVIGKDTKIPKNIEIRGRLVCGNRTKISDFLSVSGNVSIGSNCLIGKGVFINESVILDGAKICDGVKIEKSLIGKNCVIEPNAIIREGSAIGDGTVVKKYSKI